MDNSDEMQRNAMAPTVSGNSQSTPGTHTSDKLERRPKKRQAGLSLDTAGQCFAACESGLTPIFDDVSLQSFPTGGVAESGDGFTMVTRSKRLMRSMPAQEEQLVIEVSPKILSNARRAIGDLSEKKLLKAYTRDENKKVVNRKVNVFCRLERNLIGANLLKRFNKAVKPKQRTLRTPKFSIRWFLDYLHSNKELLEHRPNFVCAVSTLRLLICACYEQDEVREWTIYAKQLNGIWYLSEGWPDYDGGVPYDVQYAARMFEILSTEAKTVQDAAMLAKNFLRHEKTYHVWLAQFGEHRLLYSGDVDCVDNDGCPVELKAMTTSRLEAKLRRSWAQVYLMGSKKVVIGYLDSTKKLTDIKEMDAESLRPDASKNWRTEICIACLDKILHSLKGDPFFQDEATTYKLTLNRSSREITAKRSTIELPINSDDAREECETNE